MKRVFAVALTDSVHYKADFRPYKELVKVTFCKFCKVKESF